MLKEQGLVKAVRGLCWVALALAAAPAIAQFESGSLYGSATTTEGETLAGVELTLSGVGAARSAVSDERGRFRFLGLDPGRYHLEAKLPRYALLEYDSVSILVGRTTTIQLQMSPIPSEIVIVSTEPPLLDVHREAPGIALEWVELDAIPNTRDPWSVADKAPGVLVAGANVGGNETGLQPAFVGPGSRREENAFAIDGVLITDMAAGGFSTTYYDYEQFDQVEVTVGGTDAAVANPGVTINMLTKTGSNQARASARRFWADPGLQSAPPADRRAYPQAQEEVPSDRFSSLSEVGVEGGGPVVRDRLWGWGALGHTDVRSRSIVDTPDRTRLETAALKLNASPRPTSLLVASAARNDKIRDGMGAAPDRAPETFWRQSGPFSLLKLQATQTLSPGFELSAVFSDVDLEFGLSPEGGPGADAVLDADGVWRGSFVDVQLDRSARLWRIEGARFLDGERASHEVSFGSSWRRFDSRSLESWGPRQLIVFAAENVGTELDIVQAEREGRKREILDYSAVWLQDAWKVGRRTVDLGLRYDFQRGRTPALALGEHPVFPDLLPAIRVPEHRPAFRWSELSPRLGVSFLVGEEARNVVRASYSRFSSQLHAEIVGRETPLHGSYARFELEDLDGDGFFDAGEPVRLLSTSGVDPNDPGARQSSHVTDPGLKPEVTDEILVGLQHEIHQDLVVGLDASLRRVSGVLETRPLIRDGAGAIRAAVREDYVGDGRVAGATPDGVEFSLPVYSLAPELEYTGGRLLVNGDREQTYRGVTLNLTKRLRDRWMLRGQVTASDWTWDIGPDFRRFEDPTDVVSSSGEDSGVDAADSHGDVVAQQVQPYGANEGFFLNSSWSYDLTGAYEFAPERPWGFTLAGQISGREGYPTPYFVSVTPSDGVTRQVQATERADSFRYQDLHVLDLRLQKELPGRALSTTLSVDAFNVFNDIPVLQRARQLNGPQALFVKETLSPRVLRLGVRLSWR